MICWYLGWGGSYPVTESFRIGADLKFEPCKYYCWGMYFGPEICIFKYNLGSFISPMPKNGIQIVLFSEYNVACGLITKIPQIFSFSNLSSYQNIFVCILLKELFVRQNNTTYLVTYT